MQVAHYVAHLIRRREYFNVVDRFEQFGVRIFESHAEGIASCEHKRQFVRVNRVHLTIVNDDTHIASIRTRQRSLLHTAHNTFQNSRHEACIYRAADNRIDKDEFSAPFERNFLLIAHIYANFLTVKLVNRRIRHTIAVRLDNQMHLAKLACTAALLLVAIVSSGCFRDRLAIRNLRLDKFDRNLIIVFQAPF